MSTTTASSPSHAAAPGGAPRLTFAGILRSEWIKFRSLTSTKLLLLFTFLAVVGIGSLAAWLRATIIHQIMEYGAGGPATGGPSPKMTLAQAEAMAQNQGINIYGIPNAGLNLGILILGALAVLFIASEFGTGMIRSTMAAVPTRIPAYAAKAIVLVVVSYILTLIAALVTFLISIPILHSYGIDMSFSRDGVVYGIFLGGVYVAGVALIGLALGTLLRNSAGGIIILVVLFFLLDIGTSLLSLVPGEFWKHVNEYTPSVAGGRMLEIGHKDAFIDPGAGGLIFLAWIVVITVPALISLKTRDV